MACLNARMRGHPGNIAGIGARMAGRTGPNVTPDTAATRVDVGVNRTGIAEIMKFAGVIAAVGAISGILGVKAIDAGIPIHGNTLLGYNTSHPGSEPGR